VPSDNPTDIDLYLRSGSIGQASGARTLVIGEVLWDRFPDSTRLGGAPLNFAVHLKRLQHSPLLMSAVGADRAGEQAKQAIIRLGLDTSFLQSTPRYPTGSASVELGPYGQTSFVIERPAAYDAIELSEEKARTLTSWNPAWLYYGTLFPSCPHAKTLLDQVFAVVPTAPRFYDVNLRPGFESPDLVDQLLRTADVVKLNERELHVVHEITGLPSDPEGFCLMGSNRYQWRASCVTLGARGCAMSVTGDYVEAAGVQVDVADTVGAGDAFAAAFLHGLISNWRTADIAEFANRVGAHVVSIHGAIPDRTRSAAFDT
jgi:fructokinase